VPISWMKWNEMQFFPPNIIIIIIPSSTQSPLTHVTWATLIRVFFCFIAFNGWNAIWLSPNIIPSTQSPLMLFGYYLDSCLFLFLFPLAHFMDEMQFGCPQYHHPFNPININNAPWFMFSFLFFLARFMDEMQPQSSSLQPNHH
jgi:hypothetical protein